MVNMYFFANMNINYRYKFVSLLIVYVSFECFAKCDARSYYETSRCNSEQFQCTSGQCVSRGQTCDGIKHCNDGSDETKQLCSQLYCPGYMFRCAYGGCIKISNICNGVQDCADGSDEPPVSNCKIPDYQPPPRTHKPDKFSTTKKPLTTTKKYTPFNPKPSHGTPTYGSTTKKYPFTPSESTSEASTTTKKYTPFNPKPTAPTQVTTEESTTPKKYTPFNPRPTAPTEVTTEESTTPKKYTPFNPKPTAPTEVTTEESTTTKQYTPYNPKSTTPTEESTTTEKYTPINPTPSTPTTDEETTTSKAYTPYNPKLSTPTDFTATDTESTTTKKYTPSSPKPATPIKPSSGTTKKPTPSKSTKPTPTVPTTSAKPSSKPEGGCQLPQESEDHSYTINGCDTTPNVENCKARAGQYVNKSTQLVIRCKHGFYRTGSAETTATCVNGNWSPKITSCEKCGKFNPKKESTNDNNIPWQVAIYDQRKNFNVCWGTLVSPLIVLTAAHCFYDEANSQKKSPSDYFVLVGKHLTSGEEDPNTQKYRIMNIKFLDETFQGAASNYKSDVAILELDSKIQYNEDVKPTCTDWNNTYNLTPTEGTKGLVPLWSIDQKNMMGQLQPQEYSYMPNTKCKNLAPEEMKSLLTHDKFCCQLNSDMSIDSGNGGTGFFLTMPEEDESQQLYGVTSTHFYSNSIPILIFTDITTYSNMIRPIIEEIDERRKSDDIIDIRFPVEKIYIIQPASTIVL